MKTQRPWQARPLSIGAATLIGLGGLTACGALKPTPVSPPVVYLLGGDTAQGPAARQAPADVQTRPTLLISAPQSAASLDSPHILYIRQAHRLAYFAHSEWADTPARMLAPRIVSTLDRAGVFRAVVSTPTAAKADLRLDTEVVRLQHEFGSTPSQVRLTLRATLSDNTTRQVLAQIELDQRADAPSDDAYGGVVAANQASHRMLSDLAAFCSLAVERWRADAQAAGQAAAAIRGRR